MRILGVFLILSCLATTGLSIAPSAVPREKTRGLFSSNLSYAATGEPSDPALEKNATGLEWLQMSMGERMDCILFSMYVLTKSGEQINKAPNDYYDAVGEKLRLDPNLYSETITSILASIVKKRESG